MHQDDIAIRTDKEFLPLRIYPTSTQPRGDGITTAEVLSDWGRPGFDALMDASLSRRATIMRVNGREAVCWIELSGMPTLRPDREMLHWLVLKEVQ